ncbi:MAG TPA: hypothetical protein VFZ40_04105 [Pyrinomonadaceae bacterium]
MDRFLNIVLLVLLTACLGSVGSAQKISPSNFSGTWAMETTGWSHDPSQKNLIIHKQRLEPSEMMLILSYDGRDIKVRREFMLGDEKRTQDLEYHTDGRGETNPSMGSDRNFHTRTRWNRDRLVIKFDSFTASSSGRPLVGQREIEWRLVDRGTKIVETETTRYQENSMIDSSVSASDLRQFSIVPPTLTVRRVYKRIS